MDDVNWEELTGRSETTGPDDASQSRNSPQDAQKAELSSFSV
jgi:hypothetical protein